MGSIISFLGHALPPPAPTFTDKDLQNLKGRGCIVTGANTGIGKELARILYSKDATVYIAARSKEKSLAVIDDIKKACPTSKGKIAFLHLDLADLSTIKASAQEFLSKESELHLLFNNAGVMIPPQGSKTAQGYELQLGTNCVGPFLFTKLLTPILTSTAKTSDHNAVRVIWVSSSSAEFISPPTGVPMENLDYHKKEAAAYKYGISKAGNYLHATEFARRYGGNGIVSVAIHPGNLDSDINRNTPALMLAVMRRTMVHPVIFGAYTMLYAGFSENVNAENLEGSNWILPWGRIHTIRKGLVLASKPESEGGTGTAERWWAWCDEQVYPYE